MVEKFFLRFRVDIIFEIYIECFWYCFFGVLQIECDYVREYWNIYWIRKFWYDIVYGRLDLMFFLLEYYGGLVDLLLEVFVIEINEVLQQCIREIENNVYGEYFEYVRVSLGLLKFIIW